MQFATATLSTPFGPYRLVASPRGLLRVAPDAEATPVRGGGSPQARRVLEAACAAFDAYFAGRPDALESLALVPEGTPFQQRVWQALREIPAGHTASYGEIARRIGNPGAARAVGAANRRNPIAIAIPCHRVIGANGRLVGYAGGLDRKRSLLALEERSLLAIEAQAASSTRRSSSRMPPPAEARSRDRAAASI